MDHPAPPRHAADSPGTLTDKELIQINAYWRAANYLSVGQIYLYDRHGEDLPEIRNWQWSPPS